jgi:putative FmdB family regulatory protein
MPLYEYECKKCKRRFERIQKFSDPPVRKCPECGGSVERLLSPAAVQFKGSGWYVTDYARKSSGGAEREAKPADAASADSGEKTAKAEKEKGEAKSKAEHKKPPKK